MQCPECGRETASYWEEDDGFYKYYQCACGTCWEVEVLDGQPDDPPEVEIPGGSWGSV